MYQCHSFILKAKNEYTLFQQPSSMKTSGERQVQLEEQHVFSPIASRSSPTFPLPVTAGRSRQGRLPDPEPSSTHELIVHMCITNCKCDCVANDSVHSLKRDRWQHDTASPSSSGPEAASGAAPRTEDTARRTLPMAPSGHLAAETAHARIGQQPSPSPSCYEQAHPRSEGREERVNIYLHNSKRVPQTKGTSSIKKNADVSQRGGRDANKRLTDGLDQQ